MWKQSSRETTMKVQVKEHGDIEVPDGSLGLNLIEILNITSPDQGVGLKINGLVKDFSTPLSNGDEISLLKFDEPLGQEVFWHTSAHILAQAVLRLWPDAKPTIGPPIKDGFYYDFANLTISDSDFSKIESEVKKIIKENFTTNREVISSKEEALAKFVNNPYKQELISELPDGEDISCYTQGEFTDLCRGPHMPKLGKVKAFKILKTSGAYWRGDSQKEMLTRIYAISFPDKARLKSHLHFLEEAKKRDHKILGPKHGLFSLREEAPGMPFFHPKGMHIWNKLLEFWHELHKEAGYVEIKTPCMLTQELWVRSGHWDHYRENMYTTEIEDRLFAIKPMNCPGCMLYYKAETHSYRELPLRIAEIGNVHRYEPSGALSGLFRVRSFHQDDAHIFMRPQDIESEIQSLLVLSSKIYDVFGLKYRFELSTKPEKDTIGTDEEWDFSTKALQSALDNFGAPYRINEGDGAFYGPKIDIHIEDSLKRSWQIGTIQLDMALPERFDVEYVDQDGERKRPVVSHRALLGSVERFMGQLIEHYACRFPLWISPSQIRIIPVADRHIPKGEELAAQFKKSGFLCSVDTSHESVSKKVRNAQVNQTNYMITIGDKELEDGTLSLRTRDNLVIHDIQVLQFLEKIEEERCMKSQESPYTKTP